MTDRPSCSTSAATSAPSGSNTRTPACSGGSTLAVTMSVRRWVSGFHTTTRSCDAATAPDSNRSELSRAARPSSHASRHPVSRSR
ncbi:Uncharacterised protein [Mycobacterium tuberculosis]|uniref:Uncharacterized protein n=2 Tax=Mycobacterium tuberculosis TaxID=1773 RepID=A0A0U0SNZ1_MYCTX|nr:Uncharacterised protein [Mycobacterium tuberculosis]COX69379.1 Uncharacterised protein [Mycobacterium tuberculosis]COZ19096.1 Uncharacterised protein [Mycobacterium tuberculosis]CPA09237.1 Uncharacterised protein [Mycobacterium tuberculosis]